VVVGGAKSAERAVQNAMAGDIKLSATDRAEIEVCAGPSKGDGMS
jgi:hypothetical protein